MAPSTSFDDAEIMLQTPKSQSVPKRPAILMRSNTTGTMPTDYEQASSASEKCRYKTGKCTNTRSFKRNGQPHMLCLFHREKANRIQRKFDRQKRQSARTISRVGKQPAPRQHLHQRSESLGAMSFDFFSNANFDLLNQPMALPQPPSMMKTPAFNRSASEITDFTPDTTRYSTGSLFEEVSSSNPVSNTLQDDIWSASSSSSIGADTRYKIEPQTSFGSDVQEDKLSHEEIDFLCSAILT